MNGKEAEQTLAVIRTLMERSTVYSNVSGHAGIAAGLLALVGSGCRTYWHTPFVATWMGVLAAATASTIYFTARMAREHREPLWTRQARTVTLALSPALACALVMTIVLEQAGQGQMLPGVWMLLWGCGALAMSFFTPPVITMLGTTFLAMGALTLLVRATNDAVTMGATFGLVHLIYGTLLTLRRTAAAMASLPVYRHDSEPRSF